MSANVAVVVPQHKEELNIFEQISLAQVQKVLGHYPIIFAIPEGANFSWIPAGRKVIQFPYLGRGVKYYNILSTSTILYSQFLEYEYILIYHLDAFVFSDKLEYFCGLGYDNIGAPWFINLVSKINVGDEIFRMRIGNGGFCLRNVRACHKFLIEHPDWSEKFRDLPEDVFWSYCGMRKDSNFHTAPISVGYQFSMEHFPERCVKKNGGELPFGCHAWYKMDVDFYVKILASYGYDLHPFASQMSGNDRAYMHGYLLNVALSRLNRRINTGQKLNCYLPQNRYASIRVIRQPVTMLILARLLLENPSLSDKIYLYDETELDILAHDCQPEKLPHLLITTGGVLKKIQSSR